jgi:hypothetical protein
MSFPWIRDSSTLSGEPTNCLAVTAPTGLLLYNNASTSNSYYIYSHNFPLYIVNDGYGTSTNLALRNSRIFFNPSISRTDFYNQDTNGAITSITVDGAQGTNKITLTANFSTTTPTDGAKIEVDGQHKSINLMAAGSVYVKPIATGGAANLFVYDGLSSSQYYTQIQPNFIAFYDYALGYNVILNNTGVQIGPASVVSWSTICSGGSGSGISSIQSNNTLNIQNTTGPNTYIDISLVAGPGISVSNQGNGTWQIDNTGGGGGGGITSIGTLNNTVGITNGSGPNTYIDISLVAGSGISVSNQGNGTWQIDNTGGGGGGGDVYWNQLISPSTTYTQLVGAQGGDYNVKFGLEADTSGYYDVAELRIDDTYINNYTGYNNGKAGYLKVGYDASSQLSQVNFTVVTNTLTNPCTMATINSDMHLFANKSDNQQQYGNGEMYLYAKTILPGNNPVAGVSVYLGNSANPWYEVNSQIFNNPSDIKLKKDVLPMDSDYCTKLIKNIKPVRYIYKNDEKEKTHFGVIAQDIESIIGGENLALHSKENDTQTVCYTELIAPLIKTVQQLLERVKVLENEIKILKQ